MQRKAVALIFISATLVASVVVYCSFVDNAYSSPKPEFMVLSPENKTYETGDVKLSFVTDESASLIKYRLDGEENVTVAGNTTMTNLPNGEHHLEVFACDAAGKNENSKTVRFQIAKPIPTIVSAGPLAGFEIISPCNITYGSSTITLEIQGQMLVAKNRQLLSVTYSLDGQKRRVFPFVIKQANERDPFLGIIGGSVTLFQLSEGPHILTVHASFSSNSNPIQAQGTVFFTIQRNQTTN